MKTELILLGHGSRLKTANEGLIDVAKKITKILNQTVNPAFMEHSYPDLKEVISQALNRGAERIVIMPLFLFKGIHVTVDIHEKIKEFKSSHPDVEFIFTKELGADDAIAELAGVRIKEVIGI